MTFDTAEAEAAFPVAAVVYDPRTPVDELLAALSERLRAKGFALGGLVQRNDSGGGRFCGAMEVEDLGSGRRVSISQDRGPGARGCRLDPRGLAEAGALAGQAIAAGVDFVILNKFGKAEVEGRGLRAEFVQALGNGIPTLTSVGAGVLPAWDAFVGGAWTRLEPTLEALEAWCLARAPAAPAA